MSVHLKQPSLESVSQHLEDGTNKENLIQSQQKGTNEDSVSKQKNRIRVTYL